MRKRKSNSKKIFKKTLFYMFGLFLLYPVIVHAIPTIKDMATEKLTNKNSVQTTIQEPKQEPKQDNTSIKSKQIAPIVQVTPKPKPTVTPKQPPAPSTVPLLIPDAYITPIPSKTPTPLVTPTLPPVVTTPTIVNPILEPILSCNLTEDRPTNSKWILKNKPVGLGIRYTADIYELKNTRINDFSKSYYYILHDKITKYAKNRVIANFTITYQKQNAIDKTWELDFTGCGITAKEDNSIPMVSFFDNSQMLKSVKLVGFYKLELIGMVQKPTTYIRVLNQLDLSEPK